MSNNNKYLKYALNAKGELVHIDSVPNGNDCGCVCPACKKPLQAKNNGPTERIILPISQELTVQQHTKVPFTFWPKRKFKKHFMNPR